MLLSNSDHKHHLQATTQAQDIQKQSLNQLSKGGHAQNLGFYCLLWNLNKDLRKQAMNHIQ